MLQQLSQVKEITIGEEFRAKTPNDRLLKVRSDFSGTPVYIKCVSATGIIEPIMTQPDADNCCIIKFQDHFLMGTSYHFVIDELEKLVKTYEKPPVKKSIAGQQHFRAEIRESQESLKKVPKAKSALSFDQSYFTRTIGQIMIQFKLEKKLGPLHKHFDLFSGSGFGALQAFSCAVGYETEDLNRWYLGNLLKAIKKTIPRKGYEIATSVLFNHDHDRLKVKKANKEIRKFFKARDFEGNPTDRDLTIKDCKKEVYIPVWDISRRTIVITKETYPDMPIYIAVALAMFDPLFFDTKPIIEGMGIMKGDVVKNNDVYLTENDPIMDVVSVGSPVRIFDKGPGHIDERSKFLKEVEARHDTNLDRSRNCGSQRFECTPIDEYFQFAISDKAIQTALKSGDIDV